jgi:tRNA threonylcarbamoyladenosine biosynthesis protein TsaE
MEVNDTLVCEIAGEHAMVAFGVLIGQALSVGSKVFFRGDLGSGKTTLCRGILRAWGHNGVVKSPTYTLVEPYSCRTVDIYHFDFYRLNDPEELEFMGIRDYFDNQNICLIEWPEQGGYMIPEADLDIFLEQLDQRRKIKLVACGIRGRDILSKIRDSHVQIG